MPNNSVTTGDQFDSGKGGLSRGAQNPAAEYQKRLISLENYRYDLEQDMLDIQRYILPRKGLFYRRGQKVSDYGGKVRDHSSIIDPEATFDLKDLAAALLAGMTPKTRPWLRLGLQDTDLMEFPPVKEWFHGVTQKMLDIFAWSNLYTSLHSVYREAAGFGTGAILEEFDIDNLVRFTTFTNGEFYIAVNKNGEVDVFYRQFEMTARNIVDKFGEDNISDDVRSEVSKSVQDSAKRPDAQDKYFQVCQAIQPNESYNPEFIDNKNMKFESVYWEKANPKALLSRSGFEEQAVFVPRWDVTSTEHPYGEGPSKDVLGHVKMLQEMSIGQIKGMHKALDPPMRVPATFKGRLSLIPGAQNVDPDPGGKGISSIYDINFDYIGISNKIDDVRQQLRRGYFIDLLKMIAARPGLQPPTATEVAERHEEKVVLLSPVLERFHSDLLNLLVKRTFNIMLRNGVIPPPPEEIQGEMMRVEYTSLLAQTQKLLGLQPIETFLGFLGQAAPLQPQILDKVNFDEMADEFGDAAGVPPKIIVSDETVAAIRKARADAAAAQERDQIAAGLLEGAKSLSETSTEPGSVLGDMAGGGV